MIRRINPWLTAAIAMAGLAAVSSAQTSTDGSDTMLPADKMLRDMLTPSTEPAASPTTRRDVETVYPAGHVDSSAAASLLREGSDVVDRTGRLLKVDESPYPEFVFDNDSASAHLEPMLALPNLRLMQMEDAVTATKPDRQFKVSGTVTEYNGKNYILLESEPRDASRDVLLAPRPLPTTGPTSGDQMLNAMLSSDVPPASSSAPIPHTPASDNTSGPGAVHPNAPLLMVVQEGSEIIDRTGRLTRGADGRQAEFTFDSDGSALQDPPLIILPNLKLSTMENAVANNFRDLRFRVTGTITEYRGRNGILLEKVVVVPDAVQQF